MQVTASLLQACYLAVIKPISGCSCFLCRDLFVHKLDASCFKLAVSLQVSSCMICINYLLVFNPISGCVHIACSGLMATSLLQVVNRLDASWLSRLFICKLDVSCFNSLQKVHKYQVTLIFGYIWSLMKPTGLT